MYFKKYTPEKNVHHHVLDITVMEAEANSVERISRNQSRENMHTKTHGNDLILYMVLRFVNEETII